MANRPVLTRLSYSPESDDLHLPELAALGWRSSGPSKELPFAEIPVPGSAPLYTRPSKFIDSYAYEVGLRSWMGGLSAERLSALPLAFGGAASSGWIHISSPESIVFCTAVVFLAILRLLRERQRLHTVREIVRERRGDRITIKEGPSPVIDISPSSRKADVETPAAGLPPTDHTLQGRRPHQDRTGARRHKVEDVEVRS